jgi:hypothetical protein
LSQSQTTVLSDVIGLAAIQPTAGGVQGAVLIVGSASAGAATLDFAPQSLLPVN